MRPRRCIRHHGTPFFWTDCYFVSEFEGDTRDVQGTALTVCHSLMQDGRIFRIRSQVRLEGTFAVYKALACKFLATNSALSKHQEAFNGELLGICLHMFLLPLREKPKRPIAILGIWGCVFGTFGVQCKLILETCLKVLNQDFTVDSRHRNARRLTTHRLSWEMVVDLEHIIT